ncbi:RloB family protein [Methanohalophilus sp.]
MSPRKRKKGNRKTNSIMLLVCEGEKTERLYFENFREKGAYLTIKTMSSQDKDAKGVVEYAIERMRHDGYNPQNGGEYVYCVFDCDNQDKTVTNKELREAIEKANKNGINICFSNPFFELWFLLHFERITERQVKERIYQRLDKHMTKYSKNKNYYELLCENMEDAIQNSKKLVKMHNDNGINIVSTESNPCTQVHEVIDRIENIKKENCKKR